METQNEDRRMRERIRADLKPKLRRGLTYSSTYRDRRVRLGNVWYETKLYKILVPKQIQPQRDIRLLCDLLKTEVGGCSKRTGLGGREGEDLVSACPEYRYSQSHTHLVDIVPVWDRERIWELPVLIHEVELVSRQKHGHNQLHLQLGHPHSRARVPAGSPTEERVGSIRRWIGSQPPARVVLEWVGIIFGVQVDGTQGAREEISPSDQLPADFYILTNVPSEADARKCYSLRLPDAGLKGREFVFPCGYGNDPEFFGYRCGGVRVAEVTRN